jgi:putative transposase
LDRVSALFGSRQRNADWGKAAPNWKEAMNQFAILYDDRFNAAG